jgi:WXXGXW repeat (2 copies)
MRISSIRWLLLALVMLTVSAASSAQVLVSVSFGPPPLPVYVQPPCPGEDYIWVPGYWDWSPEGYYWVPGTWVLAPEPGLLWTPGYWAFDAGLFYWHPGYWGPVVGYYGGIAYGFGYPGSGYYGGYWRDRHFFYNRAVNNVNPARIHYVYRRPVVRHNVSHISYNGGPGGIRARPTREQEAAARERRLPPTSAQEQHMRAASSNPRLRAAENRGRPPVAATPRPADFKGHGVVAASRAGAPYKAPPKRAAPARPSVPASLPENRPEHRQVNPARPQVQPRRTGEPRHEAPHPSASPRENAPRPQVQPRRTAEPRHEAPHPSASPRENAPRPQVQPRRTTEPRHEAPPPASTQHKENVPRPGNVPHSEKQAHPQSAPHPQKNPPPNKEAHPDQKTPPPHAEEERHR